MIWEWLEESETILQEGEEQAKGGGRDGSRKGKKGREGAGERIGKATGDKTRTRRVNEKHTGEQRMNRALVPKQLIALQRNSNMLNSCPLHLQRPPQILETETLRSRTRE